MPIYEYYCRQNHTVYQFYAKTLAKGQTIPPCPDNPAFVLERIQSTFSISAPSKTKTEEASGENPEAGPEDPRMEAAMEAMEREFSGVDENDPRAMARMMRRMAELTGERIDGEMEEVVRKLEEGADPESLEESLGEGDEAQDAQAGAEGEASSESSLARFRYKIRRGAPRRDPKLYDYP